MKTCFKCHRPKSLSEFYIHPAMADGHLNKCIACTKLDQSAHLKKKMQDPVWREAEMERHRLKALRRRAQGKGLPTKAQKYATTKKYRAKYPNKYRATMIVGTAIKYGKLLREPCSVCGNKKSEAHHEDYSKPLEVMWLCQLHHSERHREINRQKRLEKLSA